MGASDYLSLPWLPDIAFNNWATARENLFKGGRNQSLLMFWGTKRMVSCERCGERYIRAHNILNK